MFSFASTLTATGRGDGTTPKSDALIDGDTASTASTLNSDRMHVPFDWQTFEKLVEPEIQAWCHDSPKKDSNAEASNSNDSACAVLDLSRPQFPAVYASQSFAQMVGCPQERVVGRSFEVLHLPDDKVLNTRVNGEELNMFQSFLTASKESTPSEPWEAMPIAAFFLCEKRGGERFWGLIRASRVLFESQPYILMLLTSVPVLKLEIFEGVRPSPEVLSRTGEMLVEIRSSVRSLFARGNGASVTAIVKRAVDDATAWLEKGKHGDIEEHANRAPQVGLEAARRFEQKSLWSSRFGDADDDQIRSCESTAWSLSDTEADDYPLVYVTNQFFDMTGYEKAWVLGRNHRFLHPWDLGRDEVFNGEECRRISNFVQNGSGVLTSLLLHQKASGEFFWNLMTMEHINIGGHCFLMASHTLMTIQEQLLSMMNTWDHRSLGYIASLRLLVRTREEMLSPMPESMSQNIVMITECLTEWSDMIKQDLCDFWEGDHFVPPVGGQAVQAFEGTWTTLLATAEESIKRIHGIRSATLKNMRDNTDGGIVCAVADPSSADCPLVFVSKEFETMTGYKWQFALGRNCRFLQPNSRQFNMMINGDELASIRSFCTQPEEVRIGTSIVNLLLNERKGGERFWNLLRMTHVDVAGRRYILAVQTVLDLPMPKFLKSGTDEPDVANVAQVRDLCMFLAKLRGRLQRTTSEPDALVTKIEEQICVEILEYMKSVSDDYEGDLYVPQVGLAEAEFFETDSYWQGVFKEVSFDLQQIVEATEDSYRSTAEDQQGSVCCTVADPNAEDCALVYISRGFEELTGYHREWALGRNCRFLQPNARAYNDAYNRWERNQLRQFCILPQKPGRIFSLVVNEARDGYPFWNALIMKHVTVAGKPYIFGVQTNIYEHRGLLGELLAGGTDGFAELGRLRSILRQRENQLGCYSLSTLINESLTQWLSSLRPVMRPPEASMPFVNGLRIPTIGIELALNEQQSLEDKMLLSLDEGVRHFHLNFATKSATETTDVEGRLFALRLVEVLAVLKQRHLHYLRDCIVFSLRAKTSQLAGCKEILTFLHTAGFHVVLWLLDVTNTPPHEVSKVWPDLDAAVRYNLVKSVGLFGGGPPEYQAASGPSGTRMVRPSVQAMDIYVNNNQLNVRQWVHINKLAQSGVAVMTCKPFGPNRNLLSNVLVKGLAKEKGMDPAMFLLKWCEGLGYFAVAPCLRAMISPHGRTIGREAPFVMNGTRRAFTREYLAASSADSCLQAIKRRFPHSSFDQVRNNPAPGGSVSAPTTAPKRAPAGKPPNTMVGAPRRATSPGAPSSRSSLQGTRSGARPAMSPASKAPAARKDTPIDSSRSALLRNITSAPMSRSSVASASGSRSAAAAYPKAATASAARTPDSQPSSPASPCLKSRSFGGSTPISPSHSSPEVLTLMSPPTSPTLSTRSAREHCTPQRVRFEAAVPEATPESASPNATLNVLQQKQQDIERRELELARRELELEQRLLGEEQRLLVEKQRHCNLAAREKLLDDKAESPELK